MNGPQLAALILSTNMFTAGLYYCVANVQVSLKFPSYQLQRQVSEEIHKTMHFHLDICEEMHAHTGSKQWCTMLQPHMIRLTQGCDFQFKHSIDEQGALLQCLGAPCMGCMYACCPHYRNGSFAWVLRTRFRFHASVLVPFFSFGSGLRFWSCASVLATDLSLEPFFSFSPCFSFGCGLRFRSPSSVLAPLVHSL